VERLLSVAIVLSSRRLGTAAALAGVVPSHRLTLAIVGDLHGQWNQHDAAALRALSPDIALFVGDFGNEAVEVVASVATASDGAFPTLSVRTPTLPLAFTRYCFTSKLYCGSRSSFNCPAPTCNAYPIAILLDAHCAIHAPPPTLRAYAMHHTILVMAISCKGQTFPVSTATTRLSNANTSFRVYC